MKDSNADARRASKLTCGPPLGPGLAAHIASLPPPVIVFNKSHSGSRLLAALLRGQGIFIGSELNDSLDALPFLPLVEHVVHEYYPDFRGLWDEAGWPAQLQAILQAALDAHLVKYRPGQPWGWKLCETTYILPVLAAAFPGARFVHLIRDGRDVAFCDHVAPELPFWRKIYFGSEKLEAWQGLPLDQAAYERQSHIYNAWHWQESVRLGRSFGAMLGPAYREVRYEALCADLPSEGHKLLAWLGHHVDEAALTALAANVDPSPAGKHRRQPGRHQRIVQRLIEPTLRACGYECEPLPHNVNESVHAFMQRARNGVRRRIASRTDD